MIDKCDTFVELDSVEKRLGYRVIRSAVVHVTGMLDDYCDEMRAWMNGQQVVSDNENHTKGQ